jgi:FtsZ-interacting cell division protein ZipA
MEELSNKRLIILLVILVVVLLVLVGVWQWVKKSNEQVDSSNATSTLSTKPRSSLTEKDKAQLRHSLQFATPTSVAVQKLLSNPESAAAQKIQQELLNSIKPESARILGIKEQQELLNSIKNN